MKLREILLQEATKAEKVSAALKILEPFADKFGLEIVDWTDLDSFPSDVDPDLKNTVFVMQPDESPSSMHSAPVVSWSPSYRPSECLLLAKNGEDIEVKLQSLKQITATGNHPGGYPMKDIL